MTKVLIYSSHYTYSSHTQYKTFQGRVFYLRKNHLCSLEEHHIFRAFHNVLHDYKHLQQENQRTYLNGIVHSHRKTEKVFF